MPPSLFDRYLLKGLRADVLGQAVDLAAVGYEDFFEHVSPLRDGNYDCQFTVPDLHPGPNPNLRRSCNPSVTADCCLPKADKDQDKEIRAWSVC